MSGEPVGVVEALFVGLLLALLMFSLAHVHPRLKVVDSVNTICLVGLVIAIVGIGLGSYLVFWFSCLVSGFILSTGEAVIRAASDSSTHDQMWD